MLINTFVSSLEDIDEVAGIPNISEVLIEPSLFSRFGTISFDNANKLAAYAKSKGKSAVLVWDGMYNDTDLERIISDQLPKIDISNYSAIRVQDRGVAYYLKHTHPTVPIHLIVEASDHNTDGLRGWHELFGEQLTRIVISIEIPENVIADMTQQIPVPFEILGAGRILLFFSPRSLLSENFTSEDPHIEVISSSPDSHNRPFPTIQTDQGTFMFLDKDQFILDKLSTLEKIGIKHVRIDLRHLSTPPRAALNISKYASEFLSGKSQKDDWPIITRAPFFRVNNTTKQFSKLKPAVLTERGTECVGTVVAAVNGKYLCILMNQSTDLQKECNLILRDGTVKELGVRRFFSSNRSPLNSVNEGDLILTDWVKGVSTGAVLVVNG